ncbi:MAG TPA: thioesterase family protein [Terriglobia bacterium]|nr:thioesterase family protein [Terriglobia bacterium]
MTMEFPAEWVSTTFRVRYAETDQMGVVYYANYLVWFEIGRSEFCRKHGFEYRDMEREDGLYIIVAEASCRYKSSARYDDEVVVKTCLRAARRRVLIFGYEVSRKSDNALLAEGETTHVIVNREGRPCALPDKYRELFETGIKAREG